MSAEERDFQRRSSTRTRSPPILSKFTHHILMYDLIVRAKAPPIHQMKDLGQILDDTVLPIIESGTN